MEPYTLTEILEMFEKRAKEIRPDVDKDAHLGPFFWSCINAMTAIKDRLKD